MNLKRAKKSLDPKVEDDTVQTPSKLINSKMYILTANIIFLITLPITLTITLFFLTLRTATDRYLKFKYGKIYGGLISSGDSVWKCYDKTKGMINVIAIMNSEASDIDTFVKQNLELMQRQIIDQPERYPKFNSICKSAMGYGYLLEKQVKLDDCIVVLDPPDVTDDYIDQEYVTKFVSKWGTKPLPLNHQALWEFVLIRKPIRWGDGNNTSTTSKGSNQYALLMRFNHIFGDGFTINSTLLRVFAKDTTLYVSSFKELMDKILPTIAKREPTPYETLSGIIKKIIFFVYIAVMAAPVLLYEFLLKEDDENILHGPKETRRKHLVYAVESEQQLVSFIKDIRKQLYGSSFTHVVLTAVSACFDRYFNKVSAKSPEFLSLATTARLQRPQIESTDRREDNNFSVALLNLPVNIGSDSMIQRFKEIKKQVYVLATSADFIVNYYLINTLCGIFPTPVLRRLLRCHNFTGAVSIVPGLPERLIGDGYFAEDIIFCIPQFGSAGIGFSVLTYNSRFQLGLIVDRALIPDVEDAQSIANDFLEQIRKLHREVTDVHKTVIT